MTPTASSALTALVTQLREKAKEARRLEEVCRRVDRMMRHAHRADAFEIAVRLAEAALAAVPGPSQDNLTVLIDQWREREKSHFKDAVDYRGYDDPQSRECMAHHNSVARCRAELEKLAAVPGQAPSLEGVGDGSAPNFDVVDPDGVRRIDFDPLRDSASPRSVKGAAPGQAPPANWPPPQTDLPEEAATVLRNMTDDQKFGGGQAQPSEGLDLETIKERVKRDYAIQPTVTRLKVMRQDIHALLAEVERRQRFVPIVTFSSRTIASGGYAQAAPSGPNPFGEAPREYVLELRGGQAPPSPPPAELLSVLKRAHEVLNKRSIDRLCDGHHETRAEGWLWWMELRASVLRQIEQALANSDRGVQRPAASPSTTKAGSV